MSAELKKVRRELEATKSALHTQALRCRQLVAAFAKKLQEKEKELRDSNGLRDRQLAYVLRSLLTLEARLRKEQRIIRQELSEKDLVIVQQQSEIEQLRSQEVSGEVRLDSLCRLSDTTANSEQIYRDNAAVKNSYRDNPVLESVQQILLKDEEDLLTVKPVENCEKRNIDSGSAWYESDSSLLVTENRQTDSSSRVSNLWSSPERTAKPEQELSSSWISSSNCAIPTSGTEPSGAWCIKVIEAGEEPTSLNGHERLWVKDKTSPPIKAQHLEEKACLQMSKRTLTIAVPKNLEEIEANSITVLESSYQELVPVSPKQNYQKVPSPQKPPALPPKPSRLLKPSEILKRSEAFKTIGKPENQTKPRVHVQEIKRKQMNGHVPGNAKPQAAFTNAPEPPTKIKTGIIENVKQNGIRSPTEKREEEKYVQNGMIPNSPKEPSSAELSKKKSHEPVKTAEDESSEASRKAAMPEDAPIRMCSSVSKLITGSARESIVTELTTLRSKQKLLDKEDPLQDNFEEFKLEECYVESVNEGDGRAEADGAEGVSHYAILAPPAPAPAPTSNTAKTYETFLETTGLSQKSILTPSRMLSNHRSCLKPKDVKHRSKVKAAAVGLGPTVKYWTEPFL